MDKTKQSPVKAREKTHFWNWDSDEDTGVRTLYLDGTIADESWWDDEITPRMFKDELMSGDSDIVVWINSPGGDCVAASQIYAMLMDYPHDVTIKIDGIAASAASVIAMAGTQVLMATDGGMVMYPTLEEKRHIIDNATLALRAMGYECPEHAVVCAIEFVNPKMTETVEAAELARMNEQGIIKNCVVVGPISYDVAMRTDIARHKGYDSPHCGDFDCLIMPNMQAGNILGKSFIVTACAPMAGVIMGAKAPAVMTSRGSSAEEKFNSIAMGALIAFGLGE